MAEFCLCPKILPENKLKGFGLTSLAVKTSRQPNTDTVMLLLVLILIQVYNEKEQVGQKETKWAV